MLMSWGTLQNIKFLSFAQLSFNVLTSTLLLSNSNIFVSKIPIDSYSNIAYLMY